MSRFISFEGIQDVTRPVNGVIQRLQVIPCTCPSCNETLEVAVAARRKPPEVLHNIARRRGWKVSVKKSTFICPEHS